MIIENLKIPKRESRNKILGFKATDAEIKKVKAVCKQKQISQTDLIRYALRQIIPNF